MTFRPGELRIFDRQGAPIGVLSGVSITGPPSFRLNEVEDMQFSVPRNDGPVSFLYDSAEPTIEGVVSGDNDTGELRLADPSGTTTDDTLVAVISYDTFADTDHGYIPVPDGWVDVIEHEQNGPDHGIHVFTRVVKAGDSVSRTFRLRARDDDAILTQNISGALLTLRGLRHDLVKGARVVDLDSITSASATSHLASVPANGVVNPFTVFAWTLANGHGTITDAVGTTQQAEEVGSQQTLHVATRIEAVHEDLPSTVTLTTANNATSGSVAIMFYPAYGTMQLLERDNLVLMQHENSAMPVWAGEIDGVTFSDSEAQVRVLGTMNLLASIPTEEIEQDVGTAATIAFRLVGSANSWKGAHGDLTIGFVEEGTQPNYGKFEYEGDILRGLQQLMQRTISECYMESGIDADTGWMWTKLHWGSEYDIDKTSLTFKDGSGSNLAPGTAIDFTGSERVNFGRLLGSETNIKEFLDYDVVLTVTEDIIPETRALIPEAKMPGARRRAALDISVDWGLSKPRQEKLAREAQDLYLDYYRDFLYAYHARFGMPFLPGFEWTGPVDDQFKKMSGRHYRTTAVLGSLSDGEIVTDWDPEDEADVSIEGWYHIDDLFNIANPRGLAYDHTETTYRYIGQGNSLLSFRAIEPYDISPPIITNLVRYTGENLRSIATDASDPGSLWALSETDTYTYVRRWDIEAKSPIREWRVVENDMTDIAINVPRGLAFTVRFSDGIIQKRDLNSGQLLESYTTGLSSLRGISASGDFVYVLGENGEIEIWQTKDGKFVGSHQTSNPDGAVPRGLFVDPFNAQVWLLYNGGVVSLYSAAIAVDEAGGGGPVDGVPGFDRISAGTFVRIVMADNRALGEPPEAIRGIKAVKHRNQFGRYVDGTWKSWGTKFDKYNCSFASHAMLLDRHTFGKVRKPPKRLRKLSGDTKGGSNMKFAAIAWKKLGYKLNYTNNGPWSGVVERLRKGRGIVLFGDMDRIPERYKCQAQYGGNHAVYVHKIDGQGRFVVHDPLCRKLKRIPAKYMRKYAGKFQGTMGRAVYSWSKVTSRKTAANDAKTYFIVWSEGEWKDIYIPGAPGDPATVTRTWDPKEQKSGFKTRAKVTLESVEQVILGEEGRVSDWDPTAMGYGKTGQHYYRSRDGTIVESEGWHLRPWDVPLETFVLNQPPWPEGESYMERLLTKYNREQGTQVFPLLNVAGIWDQIVLGGRYSVNCSLVGGTTLGIQGEVRVVSFTTDAYNGIMQVLAEWVG